MRIDVDGVDVTLAGSQILEAVDATVDEGTLVGLVGPNGAGKTTLLRSITAVLDVDDGAVFVGESEVHALTSREASRRLASVPQQSNLDFEFSVREVVEMGRHPHKPRFGGGLFGGDASTFGGDGRDGGSNGTTDEAADEATGNASDESAPETAIVDEALERAQITELADRAVTTLSGGERQRVLLARALAQDAPVLVLDEPTASLDVHHQVRTLGLVRDIVDDGTTGIAAIHDLDLAARYCDSLLLVADRTVQAAGRPADVLTPERIRSAFGADAVVTHDPITRTPRVTVRDAAQITPLDAHVHVVGGTNHVASFLPTLGDAATRLTVGPVVEGSQDAEIAEAAASVVETVPPHTSPSVETETAVRELVEVADIVVAPSDLSTVSSIEQFRRAGTRVVEPGSETKPAALVAAIVDALDRPRPTDEMPAN